MHPPRRLTILGSTGSIGTNTCAVVEALRGEFAVTGLSAQSRWQVLATQIDRFQPEWALVCDPEAVPSPLPDLNGTRLHLGRDRLTDLIANDSSEIVLNAIVGAAGLRSSLAALAAGKTLALANKETLVCGGELVMATAQRHAAELLPVDSEHSAIHQLLNSRDPSEIDRIVLTASGGPFRGRTRSQLQNVTIDEALRHPTWTMGRKITVDSATLMNKALEIIEARWLFGLAPHQIAVVVHPESVVHSFVEFKDGSIFAQLSPPDMKLPIQYALCYPRRVPGPARRLEWSELRALTFEPPDHETFPALTLGMEVAARGGTAGAALNAANEAAVERFLAGTLPFLEITTAVAHAVAAHTFIHHPTLEELLAVDAWARQEVMRWPM